MSSNWNRRTWRIAWPIMLSNVSVPLLGAVDMAVVGRLPGPQYLGAVAVGALVFTVIYHGFIFLRMGTTGLTAQALGAGKADEVRAWLARAGLLAGAIGSLIILLQIPIIWLGLSLIGPEPETAALAEQYVSIRIWGAPAALFNFALLGWFFGIQNARAALITQVFMNGLNIALDLWFVAGLGWGVEGVAWATLIAEVSAIFVGLALARANLRQIGGHWVRSRILEPERIRRMVRVNGDIFIRSIFLQVSFAAITAIGARMGATTLAANAILFNLLVFTAYVLDGYSHAAEALVGEAVGKRDPTSFRQAVRAAGRGALIGGVAFTLAYWIAGPFIIDIMTTVPDVRVEAREHLIWTIVMPVVSVWSFLYDGIFIGSTWTREMRNGMILSSFIYGAALAVLVPLWGNHGLWLAVAIFMAARALTLALRYPRLAQMVGATQS
ncbi:MAG: MATE family efflux transporter [Rhodospirillaceae bacterium]|nr:MATE family efflux transporter [Rhodospirillaceae bacterium]